MKSQSRLITVNCKRCGKSLTTLKPIISELQGICSACISKDEKYQILNEQAKAHKFKNN